jgi:hypothetical protein
MSETARRFCLVLLHGEVTHDMDIFNIDIDHYIDKKYMFASAGSAGSTGCWKAS